MFFVSKPSKSRSSKQSKTARTTSKENQCKEEPTDSCQALDLSLHSKKKSVSDVKTDPDQNVRQNVTSYGRACGSNASQKHVTNTTTSFPDQLSHNNAFSKGHEVPNLVGRIAKQNCPKDFHAYSRPSPNSVPSTHNAKLIYSQPMKQEVPEIPQMSKLSSFQGKLISLTFTFKLKLLLKIL